MGMNLGVPVMGLRCATRANPSNLNRLVPAEGRSRNARNHPADPSETER